MSLPPNLITAYQAARASRLVTQQDVSRESLMEFAQILNTAQDSAATSNLYPGVRAMFTGNPFGYHRFVLNTDNEPTILWTDPRSIVGWFRLQRLVYIKRGARGFSVYPVHTAPPRRRKADVGPQMTGFPVLDGDQIVILK